MTGEATPILEEFSARRCRLQVLIVEDNLDTADTTARILRLCGFDVCIALNGPAALKEAAANQPDVALLDIGLPGMDGYEVARRLRDQSRIKQPLFIAITGYGQDADRQLSAKAGIDLHLLKPVDPRQLEAVLKRFEQILILK